jgi:hypothetical protein
VNNDIGEENYGLFIFMLLGVGVTLLLQVIFMVPISYLEWGTDIGYLALVNIVVAFVVMIPVYSLFGFHCKLHYYGITTYQYIRAKEN